MSNNSRTLIPGIWSDAYTGLQDQGNGRLKVYSVSLAEAAQRSGTFRRGYDRVEIPGGQRRYWVIDIPPAPLNAALLSRSISSFDIGGIEYRVFTGATNVVETGDVKFISSNATVNFKRIDHTLVDVTEPPAKETDYTEIPRSGNGSSALGGLLGSEDLRIQPFDEQFVIEVYNAANQPSFVTVYLTWVETVDITEI